MSSARPVGVPAASLIRYRDRRLNDIATLRNALEQQDFLAIREVGHRIKGNAALYGLDSLGEVAVAMEKAALAGDLSATSETVAKFEECVSEIQLVILTAEQV